MKILLISSLLLILSSCNSMHRDTEIIQSDNFILNTNLPNAFSNAILRNCETALMGYKSIFGIDIYPKNKISISAILDTNMKKTQLYVNPYTDPIEIHLELKNMIPLNRPSEGGYNNIFGFAHELGHVVMMFDDSEFGEGFATYFGIHITDYIYTQLGKNAWPYPYDYVKNEGSGKIDQIEKRNDKSYASQTVLGLEQLDRKYGKKCIVDAITKMKNNENKRVIYTTHNGKLWTSRIYRKDDFIREVCGVIEDSNIKILFER
jgi:hypothetical protein